MDLLLQLLALPVRILTRLVVSLHARLFWPFTTRLTGNRVRMVSLASDDSPFARVRASVLAYYDANGCWPQTYGDLDPYGVLEISRLQSVDLYVRDSGNVEVIIFMRHGKGRFEIEPPT